MTKTFLLQTSYLNSIQLKNSQIKIFFNNPDVINHINNILHDYNLFSNKYSKNRKKA